MVTLGEKILGHLPHPRQVRGVRTEPNAIGLTTILSPKLSRPGAVHIISYPYSDVSKARRAPISLTPSAFWSTWMWCHCVSCLAWCRWRSIVFTRAAAGAGQFAAHRPLVRYTLCRISVRMPPARMSPFHRVVVDITKH
jgi:hypothetical protein